MTDLTDAIARIKATTAECGPWSIDDFLHTLFAADTAAALAPILNAVATGEMVEAPVWQDISTAPKDGTEILLYIPTYTHGQVAAYKWDDVADCWSGIDGWCGDPLFDDAEQPATHWMLFPAPPEATP